LKKLIALIVFLSINYLATAQKDTVAIQQLDTVLLQVQRIANTLRASTAAVSVYNGTPDDAARQQLSLQEYVQQVPGLFTQNATNFAQDLRISIRGFGARSSFGIRGIKLIVDGIPETTPDGQGQLDNLNLGITDRIEVIKGPSSSLYGNASGGVIALTTRSFDTLQGNFSEWKAGVGSFGFQNYQVTAGLGDDAANYVFHANYGRSNGFRDQSGFEQINTNFKGSFRLRENLKLTTILNYSDSPEAQDAGGLTLEEVQQDKRQARQQNIDFATEEAVQQFKVGASLQWQRSKFAVVDGYAFYTNRDFTGLLPFEFGGVVDFNRNYIGQGASITFSKKNNTVRAGYDFGYQNDARERFLNLEGETGEQTLDQDEQFTNLGVYILDHYTSGRWLFTGGLRFDYNKLAARDNFLTNGDDSGDRVLQAVNPSVGVNYALKTIKNSAAANLFVNFSTSFETPGLSELSANPTGQQGFNENLEAQKASSFELGIRGNIGTLQYNITGFYIETRDELISFELEDFPGRDFFRNAGITERLGIEIEGSYAFAKAWQTTFSYTFSNFQFIDFAVSDVVGNFFLPGIPKHNAFIGINYVSDNGFHVNLTTNLVGSQFAENENLVEVSGYQLLNLRVGHAFDFRESKLRPYIGINNVLNQEYTDNVRINAFGGRFFEPAPDINVYGGVVVQL
jgi:iron complex outermembrane receptor protein